LSAPEEMPVFPSVDRPDPSVIRDNQVILMLVQQVVPSLDLKSKLHLAVSRTLQQSSLITTMVHTIQQPAVTSMVPLMTPSPGTTS
jgi:hypothetical protein